MITFVDRHPQRYSDFYMFCMFYVLSYDVMNE